MLNMNQHHCMMIVMLLCLGIISTILAWGMMHQHETITQEIRLADENAERRHEQLKELLISNPTELKLLVDVIEQD